MNNKQPIEYFGTYYASDPVNMAFVDNMKPFTLSGNPLSMERKREIYNSLCNKLPNYSKNKLETTILNMSDEDLLQLETLIYFPDSNKTYWNKFIYYLNNL